MSKSMGLVLSQLQEQWVNLRKRLNKENARKQELLKEEEAVEAELKQERDSFAGVFTVKQREVSRLQQAVEQAKMSSGRIEQSESNATWRLQRDIAIQTKEADRLARARADLEKSSGALRAELEQARSIESSLQAMIGDAKAHMQDALEREKSIYATYNPRRQSWLSLHHQVRNMTATRELMRSRTRNVQASLATLQKKVDAYASMDARLQTELVSMSGNTSTHTLHFQMLQDMLLKLTQQHKDLIAEREELQKKVAAGKGGKEQQSAQWDQLSGKLRKTMSKITSLSNENMHLAVQIKNMASETSKMKKGIAVDKRKVAQAVQDLADEVKKQANDLVVDMRSRMAKVEEEHLEGVPRDNDPESTVTTVTTTTVPFKVKRQRTIAMNRKKKRMADKQKAKDKAQPPAGDDKVADVADYSDPPKAPQMVPSPRTAATSPTTAATPAATKGATKVATPVAPSPTTAATPAATKVPATKAATTVAPAPTTAATTVAPASSAKAPTAMSESEDDEESEDSDEAEDDEESEDSDEAEESDGAEDSGEAKGSDEAEASDEAEESDESEESDEAEESDVAKKSSDEAEESDAADEWEDAEDSDEDDADEDDADEDAEEGA